jgi:hypothetical protein
MKFLFSILSWIVAQSALALICYVIYYYILADLTDIDINYIQWLAIIIIATCVLPEGKIVKPGTQKEPDSSKLETFVNSIIKKHER